MILVFSSYKALTVAFVCSTTALVVDLVVWISMCPFRPLLIVNVFITNTQWILSILRRPYHCRTIQWSKTGRCSFTKELHQNGMANIHLYCQEGGKQRVKSETLSERNIEGEEKVEKLYYLYISVLLVCFLVLFFQFPISVYLESANKKSQDFFLGIFVPFQFSLSLSHSIHACSLSDFFSRMEIALMQSPV